MVEFIKVTAITPNGDTKEYSWMGDLSTRDGNQELVKFMMKCCDDTADFFGCPENWELSKWRDMTCARWEPMESNRMELIDPNNPFIR